MLIFLYSSQQIAEISKSFILDWVVAQHERILEWTGRAFDLEVFLILGCDCYPTQYYDSQVNEVYWSMLMRLSLLTQFLCESIM